MAEFNFIGEVDALSEEQLNLVKNVVKECGFDSEKVSIESVGQKGDNYAAIVKRIIVYKAGEENFKMIAKVAPKQGIMREIMKIDSMFKNEITVYSKIFPKFVELFEIQNIPEKQRFRMPACYGYISEAPNEMILLEDLQLSGFQILDRLKSMSNEEIKMVLKSLAVYHSLSYVLKKVEPTKLQTFKNTLFNMFKDMDSTSDTVHWFDQLEEDTMLVVNDEKFCKHFKGSSINFFKMNKELHDQAINSEYSVILQGDCWTNNVMYKLENGHPTEVCVIDYQMARPSSPVNDIFYLTLNCTDYVTRSKHWQNWIDFYYEELDKALSNFGLDATTVYPKQEYTKDFKVYAKLALSTSLMLLNNIVRTSDEVLDMQKVEVLEDLGKETENYRIINMKESTKKIFIDKMIGCMDTLLENGYMGWE